MKLTKKRVTASESSSFSSDRFFMKMSPRYRLRLKNKSVLGYELWNFLIALTIQKNMSFRMQVGSDRRAKRKVWERMSSQPVIG